MKFWQWLGFREAAFVFWVKNRDRECAELQEAEEKEQHGWSTRTVQVRRANSTFLTRVSCTGRAREKWFRTGLNTDRVREFGTTRVPSTGRVREACRTYLPHTGRAEQHGPCSYFGLHGSQRLCTGRVSWLSTGRADWHGSRWFCTGQAWFCTGRAIFLLLR